MLDIIARWKEINDVCCVEWGYQSLNDLVEFKHRTFFCTMWLEGLSHGDDHLAFVLSTVRVASTVTGRLVQNFLSSDVKPHSEAMEDVISGIGHSWSSRLETGEDTNPNFVVHETYKLKHTINEHRLLSFVKIPCEWTFFDVWKGNVEQTVRWSAAAGGTTVCIWRGPTRTTRGWKLYMQTQHIRAIHNLINLDN